MSEHDLISTDAKSIQHLIQAGEVTRTEIVQTHLDRIADLNSTVNSFVELRTEDVLAEAARADETHGRRIAGPLDGVPTSLKDSYAIKGLKRTDGLEVFADREPSEDEVVVSRLKDSGALILGHAAIPDLCIRWNTISGLYGTTRNPRDLSLTAGGSSGGDAANVAAGFATVGIGGDLGGSIRVPASFCGVYGFRPGYGRVPSVSEMPFAPISPAIEMMSTIGPLARNVGDIWRTFSVLAGADPRDPATSNVPLSLPASRPKVAVLREETGAVIDPEISRRLDETIEALREAGYQVDEGVAPDLRRAPEIWAQILGTDLLSLTMPEIGQQVVESGRVHIEEMFGIFDLGTDLRGYQQVWMERRRLMDVLLSFFTQYELILAPVAGMPAPKLGFDDHIGVDASRELFDSMRSTPWVNLFNLPSLALPNGIQIVGNRYDELNVLRAGAEIEHRFPVAIADVKREG